MKNTDSIIKSLDIIQAEISNIINSLKPKDEEIIELVDVVQPNRILPLKRAFIVGVNKYNPALNCDLNGCVNDVNLIRKMLIEEFDFSNSDIKFLTDYEAKKQNILNGLEWLIGSAISGDELVFYFSGHGSKVPDLNGDEEDKYDEIICPTDLDWDDPFTDDILATYFKRVPVGVNLTFICDSCNSGTIQKAFSNKKNSLKTIKSIKSPSVIKALSEGKSISKVKKFGVKAFVNVPDQNHILLAGCSENDYSEEGEFNGILHGALTYTLYEVIKENSNITWKKLEASVTKRIKKKFGFNQIPQLVTKKENLEKIILS